LLARGLLQLTGKANVASDPVDDWLTGCGDTISVTREAAQLNALKADAAVLHRPPPGAIRSRPIGHDVNTDFQRLFSLGGLVDSLLGTSCCNISTPAWPAGRFGCLGRSAAPERQHPTVVPGGAKSWPWPTDLSANATRHAESRWLQLIYSTRPKATA
jgi:hypothetical protein